MARTRKPKNVEDDTVMDEIDRAIPEQETEIPMITPPEDSEIPADNEPRPEEDAIEDEPVQPDEPDDAGPLPPRITDPEWTDYVLSLLHPSEKEDGNVTTDGLRRVAEMLLGRIVESGPQVVQAPNPENGGRAVVVYWVTFAWGGDPLDTRRFGGAADVYGGGKDGGNTPAKFAIHATASADTKAEGRALKRALRLRRVYTSEEMNRMPSEDVASPQASSNGEHITVHQKRFIDNKCRDLNIDMLGFLNSGQRTYPDIYRIPYGVALKMIEQLNRIQQGTTVVPESIKGYKSDWEKI